MPRRARVTRAAPLHELMQAGVSIEQIASELGKTSKSIQQWLDTDIMPEWVETWIKGRDGIAQARPSAFLVLIPPGVEDTVKHVLKHGWGAEVHKLEI